MLLLDPQNIASLSQYFIRRNADIGALIPDASIPVSKLNVDIATQAELDAGIGGVNAAIVAVQGTASGAEAGVGDLTGRVENLETSDTSQDARLDALETEDLRLLPVAAGSVLSTGTALKILGGTSATTGTGVYEITFGTARPGSSYVVTATVNNSATRRHISVTGRTTTSFFVEIIDELAAPADEAFSFSVQDWV
jgi:hypothetical protein